MVNAGPFGPFVDRPGVVDRFVGLIAIGFLVATPARHTLVDPQD